MATLETSMLHQIAPEAGVYEDKVKNQLSLAAARGEELCIVMPDPGGGGDLGFDGSFRVPQQYVGTPVVVVSGILDGAPSTATIAFGITLGARADDEAYDAADAAEVLASAGSVSQADEDIYEETLDVSSVTFAAGDEVRYHFYIDDNVHTFTGNFLLKQLMFRFSDT